MKPVKIKSNNKRVKNYYIFLLVVFSLFSLIASAQCPMIGVNGVFNPNEDILITSYHQSIVRTTTGLVAWGENMRANGSDATTISDITPANGYNYTGTILRFAVSGNTGGQGFLVTTTNLYAWGTPGEVVSNSFVTNANFAPMLNLPFAASTIADIHANSDALFVVINTGQVWVATTGTTAPFGNASTSTTIWQRVETSASVPLTGVVQITGCKSAGFALRSDGTIYAWGNNVELGNGGGTENLTYATQMVAPPVPVSYISIIFSDKVDPGLLALGTDTKIYGVGNNTDGELITSGTANVNVWTTIKNSSGTDFTGALFLATTNTSEDYPAAAVITAGATIGVPKILYTWGENNTNSIGQSST
jgi:alpha-tubulin suppressor-like RCC1 family protein